jgi:hypothetical protein
MKKNLFKVAILGIAMLFSNNAQAQFNLGDVLGSVVKSDSLDSSSSAGDLISGLTTVFSSSKQATSQNIVGTWTYAEPAIVLESDNILSNAAYKLAANKVETTLQSYLTQYGFTPNTFQITFNEDGTFSETLKGQTFSGKWNVVDSKLQLSIATVQALSVTTQMDGSNMQLVTDATKLLTMLKSLGTNSNDSSIKTVTSMLEGAKGMLVGITLKKQ